MNVQFLRDAFYKMKLDYGRPGKLLKNVSESTNSETGQRTVNAEVINIRDIVLAPSTVVRKFFFDLAYMKANNNFTYGGDFDITGTIVFIDFKYRAKIENELLLDGQRYQVEKVNDVASVFTILSLKTVLAQTDYNVIDAKAQSNLQPYGGVLKDD